MDLSKLWDVQVLTYVGLTCATVVIALIVLAITNRRVHYLLSEVQSLRAEMKLLDDGMQTISKHLQLAAGDGKSEAAKR